MDLSTTPSSTPFSKVLMAFCGAHPGQDLKPINDAQTQVHRVLLSLGAGDRLVRLTKADLLETFLTRAVDIFKQAAQYQKLGRPGDQVAFLALHLEVAILAWISDRTQTPEESQALLQAEKIIVHGPR